MYWFSIKSIRVQLRPESFIPDGSSQFVAGYVDERMIANALTETR